MRWTVRPSVIGGSLRVPGDKSIAHRALMLSGLASGTSLVRGLPAGEDVLATAQCLRYLGVAVERAERATQVISSGLLEQPSCDLDAGNSGTSMRLLAGILAGQPFGARLIGDDSLSRRPMDRIVNPLTEMGARICSHGGRPPLEIEPARLHGIRYVLPVASAQVKSAILLAGLFAEGETTIVEPVPTRDHTERMLRAAGVHIQTTGEETSVRGGQRPRPFGINIPGDPSSAAFFFAAAVLTGGEIVVRDLLINPTRIGFLAALRRMGARVEIHARGEEMGEPIGDVEVAGEVTTPIVVEAHEVPSLVDELPLLALLATRAVGTSVIRGAAEMRVKEIDRIAAVSQTLGSMGADIDELPDGFVIRGPVSLRGNPASSQGDHRMAMMLAVAGAAADGFTIVEDAGAAAVSFPEFEREFRQAGGVLDAA